jgi:signal transduction histidine kinase
MAAFSKSVAAQRWQMWLLVTALLAVLVTAFLVIDLTRNLRTVVISDTDKALANAVLELQKFRERAHFNQQEMSRRDLADTALRKISYEVLSSYPDVEGGYLLGDKVIGHSFPTYTEPGSTLYQPVLEHQEVLSALAESRQTGQVARRVVQDHRDLVLVSVLASRDSMISAWSLRRILNFSDSSELNKRYLLVIFMFISLISIGIVLRLSVGLQREFALIRTGLERLRTDPSYRLPDQGGELRTIVQAVNHMAQGRQELETALRREDRLRLMGRVVAGIAHEIRNPLNSIRLTSRVLSRRLADQSQAQESASLITTEIDRLDSLLSSLLVFGADEPGKLRRQPIRALLERALALVKPHAKDRNVELQFESGSDCEANVDADHLQQALMNLLLNAIDASGTNGTVALSMAQSGGRVEISVEDSGPGLTSEQQDRLFEAFYTTKSNGTGLGLAVTKTLLDKMGASITVSNRNVVSNGGANGASFRICLRTGDPS